MTSELCRSATSDARKKKKKSNKKKSNLGGEDLVHDHAEGPDIGFLRVLGRRHGGGTASLGPIVELGSPPTRGAALGFGSALRSISAVDLGQAKITNLRREHSINHHEHHVRGLEITVLHLCFVSRPNIAVWRGALIS